MAGMKDLMREYERARYGDDRRLDVHGEGAAVARERALQWIQSRAHEAPGQELLIIVARGSRPGQAPGLIEVTIRKLLTELEGGLIEWWQSFAPGSLALRIASSPRMVRATKRTVEDAGEGRTADTAGAARPDPVDDIPPELLPTARRAAELRIEREGLSIRLVDVVLREIWIEVQADAMERRTTFESALDALLGRETRRAAAGW